MFLHSLIEPPTYTALDWKWLSATTAPATLTGTLTSPCPPHRLYSAFQYFTTPPLQSSSVPAVPCSKYFVPIALHYKENGGNTPFPRGPPCGILVTRAVVLKSCWKISPSTSASYPVLCRNHARSGWEVHTVPSFPFLLWYNTVQHSTPHLSDVFFQDYKRAEKHQGPPVHKSSRHGR